MEFFGFEVYHEYIIQYVEAVEHNIRHLRSILIHFGVPNSLGHTVYKQYLPVSQEFVSPGTIPCPKIGGGESIDMPCNIETKLFTFVHSPKIGLLNGNQSISYQHTISY